MSQIQAKKIIHQPQQNQYPTRDDFLENLVAQFITRRKTLGLWQVDVNRKMGNTDRLVSKWECGMLTPTSFNLYCWAEALGCELVLINPMRE